MSTRVQRPFAHSIHKFPRLLFDETFEPLIEQKVLLQSHVIRENLSLRYAHDCFTKELQRRLGIINVFEEPDCIVDLFFRSLGTEQDSFGSAMPIVDKFDVPLRVTFDLMAIDMYHEIAEGKVYVTKANSGTVKSRNQVLARVRTDLVSIRSSTPPSTRWGNREATSRFRFLDFARWRRVSLRLVDALHPLRLAIARVQLGRTRRCLLREVLRTPRSQKASSWIAAPGSREHHTRHSAMRAPVC